MKAYSKTIYFGKYEPFTTYKWVSFWVKPWKWAIGFSFSTGAFTIHLLCVEIEIVFNADYF